jgi:hypothetical protein
MHWETRKTAEQPIESSAPVVGSEAIRQTNAPISGDQARRQHRR